ncbi:octopamine receptor Oamb-like, partial [Pollicipes pollicipes]|uniref:octopamine receptor Oamb-like n=1 Tax=Pollicipes pollicipes TaxID=41117 RepID=UPI0018853101
CGGVDWSAPGAVVSVLALALLNTTVVTGNGLVMAAIATSARLRTTTHLFIGSLAAADLLVGLLVLPFSASLQLTGSWLFGPAWCSIWLATDVWCCTASILNLCAISLDRFLAVTRPVSYPSLMSTRRARALVAAVWFVAFIIALPPLMGQRESGAGPADALCPVTECRLISERGYVVYSAVGSFFLPCFIMLFFYWRIYRAAASTTRSINKGFKTIDHESWRSRASEERVTLRIHRGRGAADCRLKIGVNKLNLKAHAKRFRVETKAAKTLAVLIGVFVLCWLPFFTLYLARPFCERCFSDTVFTLCFWLGYCNSAINPALYACFSQDFRTAFRRILGRMTCWAAAKQDSLVMVSFHAYCDDSAPSSQLVAGEPV